MKSEKSITVNTEMRRFIRFPESKLYCDLFFFTHAPSIYFMYKTYLDKSTGLVGWAIIIVVLTVLRCPPAILLAPWSTTSPCNSRYPPLHTNTDAGTRTFGLRRQDHIPLSLRRNHRLRGVKI